MAEHVCPYWVGYLLISPLRRWLENPYALLAPFVTEGMTVVEPGPGMGFYTLDLARLVGPQGRVIAIDVQPKMLKAVQRRARKAGLDGRIELRQPSGEHMGLDHLQGQADFVLAAFVVHELPNMALFFQEMHRVLKSGGSCLVAEPKKHVKIADWEETLRLATEAGFQISRDANIRRAHSIVLIKP
ncbi:class I SAM-dependent methyltransferase [bacterium]|nr:class I SAM-dependent methyltransferase [bacterium]